MGGRKGGLRTSGEHRQRRGQQQVQSWLLSGDDSAERVNQAIYWKILTNWPIASLDWVPQTLPLVGLFTSNATLHSRKKCMNYILFFIFYFFYFLFFWLVVFYSSLKERIGGIYVIDLISGKFFGKTQIMACYSFYGLNFNLNQNSRPTSILFYRVVIQPFFMK